MIKIISLIFLAQVLDTVGQIFFKKGAVTFKSMNAENLGSYFRFAGNAFRLPEIWMGFALMAIGLLLWLIALTESDLSRAIPLSSIQYLLVMGGSRLFLGEKICREKLTGTLLIVVGIILIAIS